MGNTISKKCSAVLIVGSLVFQGCIAYGKKDKVSLSTESKNSSLNASLSSFDVSNNIVSIHGAGLGAVTGLKIKRNGVDTTLSINTKSDTQIIAVATSALSLLVGSTFELILSSASAQASFPITFTLDSMNALSGQVLKFDGTNWGPASLASSQTYLGTWNAATQTPALEASPNAGDYYIVTATGDYPNPGDTYDIGDWIIYNGTAWEKVVSGLGAKLSNTGGTLTGDLKLDTLLKFKGAANYVTLKASASLVSDIILTLPITVGTNGQVLTTNGSGVLSWTTPATNLAPSGAAGGDLSGTYPNPTITTLDAVKIANGSVNNTKFQYLSGVTSDIQTQLDSKQSGGTFLTALTGDVTTAAGPGSVAATVAQVGGVSAANIAAGANLANASTNANTVSTTVKRDASGNFSAGTITATLNGTATNVTGVVAVANGGTGSASLTLNQLLFGNGTSAINGLAITGTPSVLLSTNITGAPAWTTSTTGNYLKATTGVGVSFGGILSADLPAGTLSGSGTTGKVPYYSAASTLADSPMTISGSNVGIGAATPSNILHVSGASATPVLVESTSGGISGIEFKNTASTGAAEGIMSSNDTILVQTGGLNRIYIGSNFGVGAAAPSGVPFYVKNAALLARFDNTSAGSTAIANGMNGVELVTGSMNTTNKYGQGIKFMSTDTDFATEPTKLLAGIFPRATETYNADTRGGMALDFMVSANNPGINNVPVTAMTIDQSGSVGIGNSAPTEKLHVIGNILASGTVTGASDRRLKKDIRPISDALKKLDSIVGVRYFWIDPEQHNDGEQIGVIAQDVEKVFPQAVLTGSDGYKSVSYMGLVGPVIQAIKELHTKFKTLVAHVAGLDSRVEKLEVENAELKLRLEKIEKALSK
jgi:hypothetical protein